MLTRQFGEEERDFLLTIGQIKRIEEVTGRSLQEIVQRLAPLIDLLQTGAVKSRGGLLAAVIAGRFGTAQVGDVREPILQGLIGGGMTSTEAGALVRNVFDEGFKTGLAPMLEHADLAFTLSMQALIGWQDDSLGEPKPTPEKPARRRPAKAANSAG
jgi:hypothetical protein